MPSYCQIYIIASDRKGTTYVNEASKHDLPLAAYEDIVQQIPKDEKNERRMTPEDHLRDRRRQTVEKRYYTFAKQKMNYAYISMATTSLLLFAGIQDWQTNYHIGNVDFQMHLSVGHISNLQWRHH